MSGKNYYRRVSQRLFQHDSDRLHSSERNPVPTIQGFEKEQVNQAQTEQQLEQEILRQSPGADVDSSVKEKQNDQQNAGLEEKKQLMEKMGNPKAKPTDQFKTRRGERVVDDPVTGQKVIIKDHNLKGKATRTVSFSCINWSMQISRLKSSLIPSLGLLDLRPKKSALMSRKNSNHLASLPILPTHQISIYSLFRRPYLLPTTPL